jgi:hypothetical protein
MSTETTTWGVWRRVHARLVFGCGWNGRAVRFNCHFYLHKASQNVQLGEFGMFCRNEQLTGKVQIYCATKACDRWSMLLTNYHFLPCSFFHQPVQLLCMHSSGVPVPPKQCAHAYGIGSVHVSKRMCCFILKIKEKLNTITSKTCI